MFLLPCLVLGIALALALGGRLQRVIDVPLRLPGLVLAALVIQIAVFSPLADPVPDAARYAIHVGTYALLLTFAVANFRQRGLWPVFAGIALNAAAIAANGGRMPVSPEAAEAAALGASDGGNVAVGADRLWYLGDIFALPQSLPLANVFSVGDLLIGFGIAAFVIHSSLRTEGSEAALNPARLLEPLKAPVYRRLAAGRFVSQIGDWLTLAALIGWLYGETSSTRHVAGLLLVRLGPPILGGGIAAYLVDRLPKRPLLVGVEAARGVAVAGALIGVVSGELTIVYAALAVSGCLATISAAAVPTLVPALLPDEQLPAANAGLEMAKDGAMALGALAAGLALTSVGATIALAVDLGTFAAAVLLYAGIRVTPMASDEKATEKRMGALRYVLRRRRLVILILSFATATLATGLTNASLPRFFEGEGGLGASGYGFAIAALATGLLLGEAITGFSNVGANAGRWIGAALLVMAGLFGLLGLTEHAPTALLLLGLIGFVDGTTDVLFDTVAQRETDPRYLGSVFGFASAFMASTITIAFLIAPVANDLLDSTLIILGAAALLALAGTIALVGMRSARHEADEEAPERRAWIQRQGDDISLVAWGDVLADAERVAVQLAPTISVEVVALADGTLEDFSVLLESVRKTSRLVVLHDGNGSGPAAAEIAATMGEHAWFDLDAPVTRLAAIGDLTEPLRTAATD